MRGTACSASVNRLGYRRRHSRRRPSAGEHSSEAGVLGRRQDAAEQAFREQPGEPVAPMAAPTAPPASASVMWPAPSTHRAVARRASLRHAATPSRHHNCSTNVALLLGWRPGGRRGCPVITGSRPSSPVAESEHFQLDERPEFSGNMVPAKMIFPGSGAAFCPAPPGGFRVLFVSGLLLNHRWALAG